ncbi:MAG: FimV/HubP family polar landmark protein [Steroidobacterales bacterium]
MLTRNFCRVLLLVLLLPSATLALGLGEIHLKSSLNSPLDADIDVVGANADELSGLKANLASRDTFGRNRLEYPAFMAGVTLEPRTTADGRTVLHMHSADAVNEPIATLLVEVNWARGHLVREYTVLLDPPVFSGDAASSTSVTAPVTGAAARSGSVERRAPSAAASDAGAAALAAPTTVPAPLGGSATSRSAASGSTSANARGAAGGNYTVRSGDTLSSITAQAYGAGDRVARQRELVGVYRANPAAFDGNMNMLRAGSRLALPGDAELSAISPGEAATEVHRQFSAWNSSHGVTAAAGAPSAGAATGAGQLRLVPPRESAPSASNAAGAASNAGAAPTPSAPAAAAASTALQQRVTQLESQLAESQRLLQMKNAELAALQARPAQNAPAPAPAAAPAPPVAPAAPPAATTPAPVPAAAPPKPTETPAAAPAPPTPTPHAAAPPVVSPSGNSFLDLLEEYWYLPAGLVAILIVLLVMRAVRSRQEDAFDRSLGRMAQPGFEAKPADQPRVTDTVPVRALPASREEQSYRVEESGAHEQPAGAAAAVDTAASGRHVAIDDNVPTEAPVALDQGDPLAEADFHMAYGLYDQAADLVQIASSREPERRDLRLKLLEVFFVWGNKDRFLATARELAATRDKALPGEWEKIVIMGRQIAAEDALFSSSGALPGAASGGVDLNLEGGQNRIDFDLMGEPSVGAPGKPATVDLDLGAALGDADTTGEARPVSESGVDFVFDDAERGNEQTGSTREMPGRGGAAGATATVQVAGTPGLDPDAPTVEQLQLQAGDHPTIRQKIDAAARGGMVSSEQTAELELHDLGLDLGTMESVGDEVDLTGSNEAPTVLASVDDETRQLLSHTDAEHSQGQAAQGTGAQPTDSGTWLFTDTDFVDVAGSPAAGKLAADAPTELITQIAPRPETAMPADSGSTAQLAVLESEGLDLDLGDLNKPSTSRDGNGVDLDVGTPSTGEGTFVQTQRIMAENVPLPDLEPATMSEVGTKLDLARAYMDMGDPEGARSILSEVLSEGSVSQKQEARRLIDTLPG